MTREALMGGTGVQLEDILAVFTEEITCRDGQVLDTVMSKSHLWSRSVLPRFAEARPGDPIQAGVALSARGNDVYVYHYLRRLVCRNGAIRMLPAESGRFERLDWLPQAEALTFIRETIVSCCAEEAFSDAMRGVREIAVARALRHPEMQRLLARVAPHVLRHELVEILDRFQRTGDRSCYALANAITAFARDTRDPHRRWDLEELGGAILVGDIGVAPRGGPLAARATSGCDERATV